MVRCLTQAYTDRTPIDWALVFCMNAKAQKIPGTIDFLEMVRELISKEKKDGKPVSDYAVAKRLGMSPQRVSRYFSEVSTLDDQGCQTVADTLNWPLETVLACIYFERSSKQENDSVTRAWQRLCQRVAVSVFPFFTGLFAVLAFFE